MHLNQSVISSVLHTSLLQLPFRYLNVFCIRSESCFYLTLVPCHALGALIEQSGNLSFILIIARTGREIDALKNQNQC